jgi:hypothetical protein
MPVKPVEDYLYHYHFIFLELAFILFDRLYNHMMPRIWEMLLVGVMSIGLASVTPMGLAEKIIFWVQRAGKKGV